MNELTMDRAGDKLRHAEAELKAVVKNWDDIPDSERLERIQQVQWDLANAITPAVNWRTMARIEDVVVIQVKSLIEFFRQLGNGGEND